MNKLEKTFIAAGVPEDLATLLGTYFEKKSYKKDDHLINPFKVADKIFFVNEGNLILGSVTENKTITRHLVKSSEFVTCLESFHKQVISNEFIKAAVPCEVYEITKANFDVAFRKFPVVQSFYHKLVFELLIKCQQRITDLTSLDAASYYEHIRTSDPQLFQQIKQYDLASYMGIEPQSLSRLRANKN